MSLRKIINFAYRQVDYLTYQSLLFIILNVEYAQYHKVELLTLLIVVKSIIYQDL